MFPQTLSSRYNSNEMRNGNLPRKVYVTLLAIGMLFYSYTISHDIRAEMATNSHESTALSKSGSAEFLYENVTTHEDDLGIARA